VSFFYIDIHCPKNTRQEAVGTCPFFYIDIHCPKNTRQEAAGTCAFLYRFVVHCPKKPPGKRYWSVFFHRYTLCQKTPGRRLPVRVFFYIDIHCPKKPPGRRYWLCFFIDIHCIKKTMQKATCTCAFYIDIQYTVPKNRQVLVSVFS
jgi:hypothetical protein